MGRGAEKDKRASDLELNPKKRVREWGGGGEGLAGEGARDGDGARDGVGEE